MAGAYFNVDKETIIHYDRSVNVDKETNNRRGIENK